MANEIVTYPELPTGGMNQATLLAVSDSLGDLSKQTLSDVMTFSGHVDAKLFGVTSDGITDDSTALLAANAYAYPRGLKIRINGPTKIGTQMTILAELLDHHGQMFDISAKVIIAGNNTYVRPDWFGDVIYAGRKAVDALPASGGVIKLEKRTYKPFYPTFTGVGTVVAGVDYLAKSHVIIQGAGKPSYANLNSSFVYTRLEGGTIINGTLPVFAENFAIEHLGVDCGIDALAGVLGGVVQDQFFFFKPNQSTTLPYAGGFYANQIATLGPDRSALAHNFLAEGIAGGDATNISAFGSFHGIVIKSQNFNLTNFWASQNNGEGLILKSDAYAIMSNVNVTNGNIGDKDPRSANFGILIQGVGSGGGKVNISNVQVIYKQIGVQVSNNGNIIGDVNIDNVTIDQCNTGIANLGSVARIHYSNLIINNCATGVNVTSTSVTNKMSGVSITNATNGFLGEGVLNIDNVAFDNVTANLFNYSSSTSRFFASGITSVNSVNFWNLSMPLINGWANFSGGNNSTFNIGMQNRKVTLYGLIVKTAATGPYFATLATNLRPPKNLRFAAIGFSTPSTYVAIEVIVQTDGNIGISNRDSAPTYISLDGISWDM